MKLTLLSKRDYTNMALPEKPAGRYMLRGKNAEGKMADIVAVEAVREQGAETGPFWSLRSNRRFKLFDKEGGELQSAPLRPLALYKIASADGNLRYVLYTEPQSEDRRRYQGYEIAAQETEITITIGRDPENGICYTNEFVSGNHAKLVISKLGMSIKDQSSANGTYVNGRAVGEARLNVGDVVYIMGMQLIAANRLLFLNDPDKSVSVQSEHLREYTRSFANEKSAEPTGQLEEDEYADISCDYYYRAPRFWREAGTFELKLDPPPSNQVGDELPMAMLLGPSLTMGMASAASGVFALSAALGRGDMASAMPSLLMSVSMLCGTLIWPLVTKTFQRKSKKLKEAKRQETYQKYLAQMERQIEEETARQEEILRENDASVEERMARLFVPSPGIWERARGHSDFLSLRLGLGSLPLKANISYSARKFTVEEDNLAEAMYEFGETERNLKDVPVCLSLSERFVCGIYAKRERLASYAQGLILQLAMLHSYDELKLAVIYDERDADKFSFVRWLPHVQNNAKTLRYIATNSDETKELSAALDGIIEHRKTLGQARLKDELPYFVIICLDKELSAKAECVRRVQEHGEYINFSVVAMFERLVDLPKECSAVVELCQDGSGALTHIGDTGELPIKFYPDPPLGAELERAVRILANTEVDISGSSFSLPKKYTFFEMLNLGMVEHLNLVENWASNDPTKSLAASVGVDGYGELFKLDLHERAHGPHGLVAGMTGSGKSEFLIAYILSMAVSFHPHEAAFILIDYKGGGMAKSFENIPHTAGVITNLDGNNIKRSLVSMKSELHRRERIFRDVSKQRGISNIDIYKYQKLYREGKVSEPLPHLLIISDEFAELKKDQPDFMSELTSTARVGRSLGVHLILATQKPGGVVDEQIRSNSRFRICLKVQDNSDSMEMLGRPEAAALVDTGRFFLQVGYNELFELGQSAWAGAPYYPSAKVIKEKDDAVSAINTNGRVIAEANTDRFANIKDPPKQLDVITAYIKKVCDEEHIQRWSMWLDPLPGNIYIDELEKKYPEATPERFVLEPLVGELDDPANQAQKTLSVPLTKEGNAIVYGSAGSGKEMFVEALCHGLITKHSPEEVNIYIMDFGAETLTAFCEAPHIGDVILSYETEKVNNLFKLMLGKIETRKKLLSQFGGDMASYNKKAQDPEPSLVVIINNYAAFTELFEDKSGEVNYLTREGTKYGIYFVLCCTGANNVRFSLLQNFRLLYCLQLNNPDEYSSVVGKTEGLLPEKHKGRGLLRLGKDSLLEFQTVCITKEESPFSFIRECARDAAKKYAGKRAAGVPVLPEKVTAEFLAPYMKMEMEAGDLSCVPIGLEKESLEVCRYNFAESPVNLVLAANAEWQSFADALASMLARHYKAKTLVISPAGKTQLKSDGDRIVTATSAEECAKAACDIYDLVLARNNEYKDKLASGQELPSFEPVFAIIESISLLRAMLEQNPKKEEANDAPLNKLLIAMEKCDASYGMYFILAEGQGALTPFTLEGWYKAHIGGGSGIWVGSGIGNQYRLTVNKKPPDFLAELEADFGFAVSNASATLIKLLNV